MTQTLKQYLQDLPQPRLITASRELFRWHDTGVLPHEATARQIGEEIAEMTGSTGDPGVENVQRAQTLIMEEATRRWLAVVDGPGWLDWDTHATHNLDRWVLVDFGTSIESAKVIPSDNDQDDYAHMLFDGDARQSRPRHLMSISALQWLEPTADNARALSRPETLIIARIANQYGHVSHEDVDLDVRPDGLGFRFGSDPDLTTDGLTLEAIAAAPVPPQWRVDRSG